MRVFTDSQCVTKIYGTGRVNYEVMLDKTSLPGTLMYYQLVTNVFKSILAGHLVRKLTKSAVLWRHLSRGFY